MNRKTLLALVTFAGLGLLTVIALTRPEKGERASDRARPIPRLTLADIETIEVTKAGATSVIKSEGGKYKMVSPVPYPAEEGVAKAAFEGLGKMDVSDLVSEQKTKQAEFEVDDKSGLHVVVKAKGNKVLADLTVGKSTGPGTMVRPAGKDEIWQATGISRYLFDKTPSDWRDKSLTTFTQADAEQIDVVAKDGAKAIVKKTGAKVGAGTRTGGRSWSRRRRSTSSTTPSPTASPRRSRCGRRTTSPTASSWRTRGWSRRR